MCSRCDAMVCQQLVAMLSDSKFRPRMVFVRPPTDFKAVKRFQSGRPLGGPHHIEGRPLRSGQCMEHLAMVWAIH